MAAEQLLTTSEFESFSPPAFESPTFGKESFYEILRFREETQLQADRKLVADYRKDPQERLGLEAAFPPSEKMLDDSTLFKKAPDYYEAILEEDDFIKYHPQAKILTTHLLGEIKASPNVKQGCNYSYTLSAPSQGEALSLHSPQLIIQRPPADEIKNAEQSKEFSQETETEKQEAPEATFITSSQYQILITDEGKLEVFSNGLLNLELANTAEDRDRILEQFEIIKAVYEAEQDYVAIAGMQQEDGSFLLSRSVYRIDSQGVTNDTEYSLENRLSLEELCAINLEGHFDRFSLSDEHGNPIDPDQLFAGLYQEELGEDEEIGLESEKEYRAITGVQQADGSFLLSRSTHQLDQDGETLDKVKASQKPLAETETEDSNLATAKKEVLPAEPLETSVFVWKEQVIGHVSETNQWREKLTRQLLTLQPITPKPISSSAPPGIPQEVLVGTQIKDTSTKPNRPTLNSFNLPDQSTLFRSSQALNAIPEERPVDPKQLPAATARPLESRPPLVRDHRQPYKPHQTAPPKPTPSIFYSETKRNVTFNQDFPRVIESPKASKEVPGNESLAAQKVLPAAETSPTPKPEPITKPMPDLPPQSLIKLEISLPIPELPSISSQPSYQQSLLQTDVGWSKTVNENIKRSTDLRVISEKSSLTREEVILEESEQSAEMLQVAPAAIIEQITTRRETSEIGADKAASLEKSANQSEVYFNQSSAPKISTKVETQVQLPVATVEEKTTTQIYSHRKEESVAAATRSQRAASTQQAPATTRTAQTATSPAVSTQSASGSVQAFVTPSAQPQTRLLRQTRVTQEATRLLQATQNNQLSISINNSASISDPNHFLSPKQQVRAIRLAREILRNNQDTSHKTTFELGKKGNQLYLSLNNQRYNL